MKEIQKRLPDDIVLQNQVAFEFSEDEFVSILSWIKFFNLHYKECGKTKQPSLLFPVISKRLHLDFGHYNFPSDTEINKGKFIIYLSENGKLLNGKTNQSISVKETIKTWKL